MKIVRGGQFLGSGEHREESHFEVLQNAKTGLPNPLESPVVWRQWTWEEIIVAAWLAFQ